MKKMAAIILTSLLWTGLSAGQSLLPPDASTDHPPATGVGQKRAQERKEEVSEMRRALTQLKANAPALKDGAVRKQAQLDAELWEQMVEHLEHMTSMAAEEGGHADMACGQMHDASKCEGCTEMQHEGAGSPGRQEHCCEMMGAMGACTRSGMKASNLRDDHAAHQHPDEGTNPK